jgi:ATP-binding protein involved in chromosome partitioning
MINFSKENIIEAISHIVHPNQVSAITIRGEEVGFVLTVSPEQKASLPQMEDACRSALQTLGANKVHVITTVHNDAPIAPRADGPYQAPRARANWNVTPLEGVNKIIAVASGKGGVGKSTTTVNLAHAARAKGLRVGILDADIYGPSIPLMLGLTAAGQPEIQNGKMQPHQAHGLVAMSMQFITGDGAAILRGPMISKTLQQMLRMTAWGELDVLFVDMPPGTGDVALSLAQQVPLSGVIVVTTPQDVAVADARKCAEMFQKLDVPLLGVIENMSWFEDGTGARHTLFGSGGGAMLAKEFGAPLLAQLPIHENLRKAADNGTIAAELIALYDVVLPLAA